MSALRVQVHLPSKSLFLSVKRRAKAAGLRLRHRQVTDTMPADPFKQRATVTYDLKQGNGIVYRGTTTDARRREAEHRDEGWRFDRLCPTSANLTPVSAKRREEAALASYRRGHGGSMPPYNEAEAQRSVASASGCRPQPRRNMQTYGLKRGRQTVYLGISYDLEGQEQVLRAFGRDFDQLVATSPKMTQPEAERLAQQALAHYRAVHAGQEPLYNARERDAARQLIRMGGSQPNLSAPPRRRRVGSIG